MLDYMEAIMAAQSIEEIWPVHKKAMAGYGFNRLIYGMTRSRSRENLGNRDDFLVLTNMPESYMKPYFEEGLYLHAPMMQWVLHNTGACSWSWMAENEDNFTERQKYVMQYNYDCGIRTGYSIGFNKITQRSRAAIAMIADIGVPQEDVDAMWAEHGREILAMNNNMHLKVMNLPYTAAHKNLTNRQREALEWVGEGKTTQDIGTIMGLTAATIEKHLRLAREVLDVETTAQAVVKASFQNQIFLIEA